MEVEAEMVQTLKNNMKNRGGVILSSMVEKFNKEFNYDISGAQRNWKVLEDDEFKEYFIRARK